MALSRLLARPMVASMFVLGGAQSLKNAEALATRAKPVADRIRVALDKRRPGAATPSEVTLVRFTSAAQVLAGLALATGRMPRTSAFVLAGTLVPTTLTEHRFWEESDPAARHNQQLHFFKNVSMMGGLLIVAGDTEGRPGLAWRAKHAVADARDHLPV